ncbi:hypothetical protein PUN28_018617 [Cardiocondyla obscurior]|uniref:Secreted protein n=1 Tax=Cardiocondyla obscurior TaxID=286306 RepID=A0AAW2EIW5_9HYME
MQNTARMARVTLCILANWLLRAVVTYLSFSLSLHFSLFPPLVEYGILAAPTIIENCYGVTELLRTVKVARGCLDFLRSGNSRFE